MALFQPGPQGPAGPPGMGSGGGNSFLSGSGVPSDTLGSVGDHYVNIGASPPQLYGPKTTGGWGTPVPLGGSGGGVSISGTGFAHVSSNTLDGTAKKVDLSASADVTNTLGVPNGGTGKTTSDLSGQANKAVVVNSTADGFSFQTFPSGASVPTGNGFRKIIAGVEQATAAAVNLAASSDVTGVLPRANQQDQNMAGDVGGTTGANTVNKIQGVAISGTPATGQTLTATSPTAATWSTPSGGGSGEANTMSSAGGTYSIVLAKSGVNLPVKGFSITPPMGLGDNGTFLQLGLPGLSGYGTVGQSIRVAASGSALEWFTPSSGGSGSPGGSNGQLQINSSGSFGGFAFGAANQVLAMNSSGTGLVWTTVSGSGSPAGTNNEPQIYNGGAFGVPGNIHLYNGYATWGSGTFPSVGFHRFPAGVSAGTALLAQYKSTGDQVCVSATDTTLSIGGSWNAMSGGSTNFDTLVLNAGTDTSLFAGNQIVMSAHCTGTIGGIRYLTFNQPRIGATGTSSPYGDDGYTSLAGGVSTSMPSTATSVGASDLVMNMWYFTGSQSGTGYYYCQVPPAASGTFAYKKTIILVGATVVKFTDGSHTVVAPTTSSGTRVLTLCVTPNGLFIDSV